MATNINPAKDEQQMIYPSGWEKPIVIKTDNSASISSISVVLCLFLLFTLCVLFLRFNDLEQTVKQNGQDLSQVMNIVAGTRNQSPTVSSSPMGTISPGGMAQPTELRSSPTYGSATPPVISHPAGSTETPQSAPSGTGTPPSSSVPPGSD